MQQGLHSDPSYFMKRNTETNGNIVKLEEVDKDFHPPCAAHLYTSDLQGTNERTNEGKLNLKRKFTNYLQITPMH